MKARKIFCAKYLWINIEIRKPSQFLKSYQFSKFDRIEGFVLDFQKTVSIYIYFFIPQTGRNWRGRPGGMEEVLGFVCLLHSMRWWGIKSSIRERKSSVCPSWNKNQGGKDGVSKMEKRFHNLYAHESHRKMVLFGFIENWFTLKRALNDI